MGREWSYIIIAKSSSAVYVYVDAGRVVSSQFNRRKNDNRNPHITDFVLIQYKTKKEGFLNFS